MPQLPALGFNPQNALLRVEPLTNALAGMRQANFENERLGMEQERLNMAKQSHSASMARGQKNDRLNTIKMIGGWAQQADAEQDPMKRQAMWQRIKNFDPDAANDLRSLGIDPDDHVNGPKAVIGLLQGYQDPQAQEMKRLQVENQRANLDLTRARAANVGRGGEAPKTMVVGGRVVRVEGDQARDITPASVGMQAPKFTPAETATDKAYARSYEEDIVSGGLADAQKNLTQLQDVKTQLESGQNNLTGPVLGRLPDAVASFTNPKAVDARERVEEVVQRNLRLVLGAQFTNEEGKRLIARAYNPALDEATNARRLGGLITAMDQALKAKQAAAQYYEANGTLRGFKGRTDYSVNDLERAMDNASAAPKVQGQAPGGGDLPAPRSREEYMQLPSGATYRDPEGNVRTKP